MKTIWLFGESGCGKTTVGKEVVKVLKKRGRDAVLIDGDDLRNSICDDLSFSYGDRLKQTTRASYMAKAVNEGNSWAVVCLITPFKEFREEAKRIIGGGNIGIFYLASTKEERIKRDPKGLYKKAIAGEIKGLTGYDGAFDKPPHHECFSLDTKIYTVISGAEKIIQILIGETFENGGGI